MSCEKPTSPKPAIISSQVEGSGTAETGVPG